MFRRMKKRPVLLLLSSVIIGAIAVLGCAAFALPREDHIATWHMVLFFGSLGLVGISVISVLASLVWWVAAILKHKSS